MCGIAGYVGIDDEQLLKKMIGVLRHRGPDDTGFFADEGIGLACARLSIIDIEGGHQPVHNEDGTLQVAHNGEIYNFQELRRELEGQGHRFYTKSDTEVIVHSYEQHGESFVSKLNGMFAIALWDSRQRKLLLARDRMGIKPLYYWLQDGQVLLFASEIKGLLQAHLKRAVDRESLCTILNLGYIPGSGTLLEGVRKLPPSTLVTFQDGSLKTSSYWNVPVIEEVDEGAAIPRLRVVLEEAVSDQLVADVPVGCFLSGGIDTSAIVAFASKLSNQPLKTFCMGFGEETDEFRDARLIAQHFGTDHEELMVDISEGMRLYPKMIWHMEAPKYNLYPWFVCELVRRHVKVCLSGNGGDEIFGGYYARYENALRIEKLGRIPLVALLRSIGRLSEPLAGDVRTKNRLRVLKDLRQSAAEYLILAGALPDSFNRRLFQDNAACKNLNGYYSCFFQNTGFLQGLINAELRTKLVDDLLAVDDSMSMAHSLELRVPLLDSRIVDLMAPINWKLKYAPGTYGKVLLRKAIRGILPEAALRKPKWGFSVNVFSWYKGELGELVHQILPESDVIARYFSHSMVMRLLGRPLSGRDRRYQVLLWQMLGFHFWHRIFIDNEPSPSPKLDVNELVE